MRQNPEDSRNPLSGALDRHFMACAAVATVAAGVAHQAEAAIVYSGTQGFQSVVLPSSGAGIYFDLATGQEDNSWQINPYVNATSGDKANFRIYLSPSTALVAGAPLGTVGTAAKLTAGTAIGSTSTFSALNSSPLLATPAGTGPWGGASTGGDYLGIEFTNYAINNSNPVYGWIQLTKDAGTPSAAGPSDITLVDWAYEDSGAAIAAGATGVPEPSSLALLAAGATGLLVRRGRVKLRSSEASGA